MNLKSIKSIQIIKPVRPINHIKVKTKPVPLVH